MEALVITPELEAAAQRLAEVTGLPPTEAVTDAIRKQLGQSPVCPPKDVQKIRELIRQIQNASIDYSLTEDEILGYDQDGIPEQPYLGR